MAERPLIDIVTDVVRKHDEFDFPGNHWLHYISPDEAILQCDALIDALVAAIEANHG